MKIVLHDYAGHPFQVQLSRRLAERGHDVTHVYFADNPGPKGAFGYMADGPGQLRFVGVTLGRPVAAQALFQRRRSDIDYGKKVAALVAEIRPDSVISGNTPTEAQGAIIRAAKSCGARFVYWLQDVYSVAVTTLLERRLGRIGALIGAVYRWMDRRHFQASNAIVVITKDFETLISKWISNPEKIVVIENWGNLSEIHVGSKINDWSKREGIAEKFTFLYSGTLGLKHKPELLLHIACKNDPESQLVVVGQGTGLAQLREKIGGEGSGLTVLPIQPAEALSDVLATADVLVAVIEKEAGMFAVPSKVQSYLCAGRPILLAAPSNNLAARIVTRQRAGIVVDPDDELGFVNAAARLRHDGALRAEMGALGRSYAETAFDIDRIADRFEAVLRNPAR